jgi:hypothetical protein
MRKLIPNRKHQRAQQLLDAWLRGMNEGGHPITAADIKAVFLLAVAQAAREAEPSAA